MFSKYTKKRIISFAFSLIFLLCWMSNLTYAKDEESIVAQKIGELSSNLRASFKAPLDKRHKIRIAIIELENLSDRTREKNIGKIVSEMLTTNLVQAKLFEVVEREQLNKVLEELRLNLTGAIDAVSAKRVGNLLAAEAILCGSVSEVGQFLDINVRLIDVEKASILTAAIVEIRQADFLVDMAGITQITNIRQKVQNNLDALNTAIHYYSGVETRYEVVWPKRLSDLVPDYLDRIPDPIKGSWIYKSKTGKVYNSAYPEITPTVVYPKAGPMLDKAKKAVIMAGLGTIRTVLKMYWAEEGKYPRKLTYLVPDYLAELPNALDGSWRYNHRSGKVWHSKYKVNDRKEK